MLIDSSIFQTPPKIPTWQDRCLIVAQTVVISAALCCGVMMFLAQSMKAG